MPGIVLRQRIKETTVSPWNFGLRLALSYGAIFAFVLSMTGFFLIRNLEQQTLDRLKVSLLQEAQLVSTHFSNIELDLANRPQIQRFVKDLGRESHARITVIDLEGNVLGDSLRTGEELFAMDNHEARPEVMKALKGEAAWSIRRSQTLKMRLLYGAVPLTVGNETRGVLRLALTLEHVEQVLAAVKKPILLGTLLGIAASVLFSVLLGQSIGRRISEITEAACRYARGDLTRKIFVKGDDDIRLLAHAMNQMAISLKKRIGETETEKKKLTVILENMAEGVIAVNLDRDIMLANPSAEDMFQVPHGSATGKSLLTVTKKPQLDEMMAEAIGEQKCFQQEVDISRPESKLLRGYFVGIASDPGAICGIVVLTDITQIRRLENLRREFVANVSHELRTPLTSIRGFIETLLQGALEDTVAGHRFLKMMEEDARRLERLIADLMELSKLEAKQTPLQKQPLSLAEEVDHVAAGLQRQLAEKMITFTSGVREDSVPKVFADRDRVRQVLVNLLDNAIKFNRSGGTIHIESIKERDVVKIVVKDTGLGIPDEAISRLFERFYRVDKARSRDLGGTGLGLSIVKHIVEIHGGIVGCESIVGKGSAFFFTLPVYSAQTL